MYRPWQLICFGQMIRFVSKSRCMPHTTSTQMALCDAIADFHKNHHNDDWFAQLVSFCDSGAGVECGGHGCHTSAG